MTLNLQTTTALVFRWFLQSYQRLLFLWHLASISFACFETILLLGCQITPAWTPAGGDQLLLNISEAGTVFLGPSSVDLKTLLVSRASLAFSVLVGRVRLDPV